MDTFGIENIARVAHEANRALQVIAGDTSTLPWQQVGSEQRASSIAGVEMVLANPGITPADLHRAWFERKRADGWTWGPTKSEMKQEHPCMLAFDKLPEFEQRKDVLFLAVVNALAGDGNQSAMPDPTPQIFFLLADPNSDSAG